VFIVLGLILIGIGGFLTYYGQDMLGRTGQPSAVVEVSPALSPRQERLLELIAAYQRQFAAEKLIISRRNGSLHFDSDPERGKDISVLKDLFGKSAKPEERSVEFQNLMESLPPEYVRFFAETRLDSPFVVAVTPRGLEALHSHR